MTTKRVCLPCFHWSGVHEPLAAAAETFFVAVRSREIPDATSRSGLELSNAELSLLAYASSTRRRCRAERAH